MSEDQRVSPEEAVNAQNSVMPDAGVNALRHGDNAWIMQAINQLISRIDGVENRLRRIENRISWVIGIAIGIGIVFGLLSRIVDFSFTISIIPSP